MTESSEMSCLGILFLSLLLNLAPLQGEPNSGELDHARFLAIDGEYEEALSLFLGLLEDAPDDIELNYYTGLCYFFLRDSAKSIHFLQAAADEGAEFPEAYYWLGQAYLSEWKPDKASEAVAKGLALFPRNEKLRYLSLQSRVAGENGRRRVIGSDPDVLIIPVQPPISGEPLDDLR